MMICVIVLILLAIIIVGSQQRVPRTLSMLHMCNMLGSSLSLPVLTPVHTWQVVKAQGVARDFGTRIDWIQPMMNLVKRQAEVEILPMAEDLGIEVAPYSPLGGGLLTGADEDQMLHRVARSCSSRSAHRSVCVVPD